MELEKPSLTSSHAQPVNLKSFGNLNDAIEPEMSASIKEELPRPNRDDGDDSEVLSNDVIHELIDGS